jgi:hypothetical protein
MCDVSSMAVFGRGSNECLPDIIYKYISNPFVAIPVAPITMLLLLLLLSLLFVSGWICLLPVQASEWSYKDGSNGEYCQTSLKFKL